MSWSHSIEALAATMAIVLLLFTPMLDPMVSLVFATVLLVGLVALLNFGGRAGATRS